ncbi:hypothetical protein LROSL3_2269 [Furfurilactobacillus rossiae]|jgi:hypothetical protein|nr:hypothetical protein LROSL2_2244 [Furfurilactobacillus rossiae]QLE69990.1 hypothetical protein LROSL3_2269 [Furfurilactobacillus rossiae]
MFGVVSDETIVVVGDYYLEFSAWMRSGNRHDTYGGWGRCDTNACVANYFTGNLRDSCYFRLFLSIDLVANYAPALRP